MSTPDAPVARATVVGGGPGGLMAAEVLAGAGLAVTLHDRMPSVGRKFLLAGRGGLNLTHSEPIEQFLGRYGDARAALTPAIEAFGPHDLRDWAAGLGRTTFVGSSGRVFPEGLRATELLHAWVERLGELDVRVRLGDEWLGWPAGRPTAQRFRDREGERLVESDVTVLALGGASWPRVGSNGVWVDTLVARGVEVTPLTASNAGFEVQWTSVFADRFAGVPVKNISAWVGEGAPVRGELMIVDEGIEGGVVYAVGRALREELAAQGEAVLHVDLRPDLPSDQIAARLARRRPKDSWSKVLERSIGLAPVAIGLLREVSGNRLPEDPVALAGLIGDAPVRLAESQPLDRAISTAGGVRFGELDERYMLRDVPGVFVAGEMLDWDAPTGGYLLQATFSTAVAAARGALDWLGVEPVRPD